MDERGIVITGANGFIGRALSGRFEGYGAVKGLTRANCDYTPETMAQRFRAYRPRVVYHAAGNASVAQSYADPAGSRASSVDLTRNVLDAVRASGTNPRTVLFSTAAVYGNPETLPVAEDAPLKPVSPYGEHKLECEALARDYAARHSMDIVIVRIFSLFGTGQRRLFLHEIFEQFENPDLAEVTLKGTGTETRDYLPVHLFAEAVDRLSRAPLPGPCPVYNVGSGRARSMLECAQTMGRILESPKTLRCLGEEMPGNPLHWQANIDALAQATGWRPQVDFETELRKVVLSWKNKTARAAPGNNPKS